jgi:hypothetical protein
MNLYSAVVSLHVIAAILGLGPLSALAVVTSRASAPPVAYHRLTPLMRITGWSLLGVLLTGCAIMVLTRGVFGETRWVKASFALFVVLGFLHGQARRQFRRAQSATLERPYIGPLPWILWSMCALVAAITYLMEAKPW